MKILLTGKNGQVGFELRRSLAVLGEIYAIDIADCDLSNANAIRQIITNYQPDVIVNPAAYTAVDKAENDIANATAINANAPSLLAEMAETLGAVLVHYSTDYVFDGEKLAAYTETDAPNPQNVYGTTKLAGELAIQNNCQRHVILRTSWVVGAHGNNFAKTVLQLATERNTLKIVADQIGVPTSASLLADLTAHLVNKSQQNIGKFPYGLYHATADGETNWYEYACYVIKKAQIVGKKISVTPDSIHPISTVESPTPAKRPLNSRLDTTKLRKTFGLHLPNWQDSLDHILDQILL
ncbi:dTDP-4-dehydrorhamnose reductase [Achromatium sp. WMS3]|nr:dTDP-4-dehydrorhamnose reductase [Achromatium sp. WMS3]